MIVDRAAAVIRGRVPIVVVMVGASDSAVTIC